MGLAAGCVALMAACGDRDNGRSPGTEQVGPGWSDVVLAALPHVAEEFTEPVRVDPAIDFRYAPGPQDPPPEELERRVALLEEIQVDRGDYEWESDCRYALSTPPGSSAHPKPGECDIHEGAVVIFGEPTLREGTWTVQAVASNWKWDRIIHIDFHEVGGVWTVTSFTLGDTLRW